jgi:aldose 1-epimerase
MRITKSLFLLSVAASLVLTCRTDKTSLTSGIEITPYGMIDNIEVLQYTIRNKSGMEVKVLNYGGTITDIIVPDRVGVPGNVVLGFTDLDEYVRPDNPYIGATIGRFANRIARASFIIGDQEYRLAENDNGNALHGGVKGFDRVVWDVEILTENSLKMSYTSPDGEEGYPGTLHAEVVLTVGTDNAVTLEYYATTDKPTPVNLTNHSYFNLSAGRDPNILYHELTILADTITPVDDSLIPTGELMPVGGTPFDFRTAKRIGRDIDKIDGGYDHNYELRKEGAEPSLASVLVDPGSGRKLELWTTKPGVQFYSGNFLDGTLIGRGGQPYEKHAGLCLEPQYFPDSPNQPSFPDAILQPGQTYRQTSIFKFSVQ